MKIKRYAVILFSIFLILSNSVVLSQIQLSLTVKQPSCIKSIGHDYQEFGDGSILVSVTGGIPPYTFTVSGLYGLVGATQNNNYFPGLMAGPYTVSIFDAIGEYASTYTTLTASYTTPILNLVSIDSVTSCDGMNGTIKLNAQGGTPPYWYSIDGGTNYSANGNFSGLSTGIYAALVKDNNGCISFWNNGIVGANTMMPPYIPVFFSRNACDLSIESTYSFTDVLFSLTSCNKEGGALIRAFYNMDLNGNVLGNGMNLEFSTDGINYAAAVYTPPTNYTQALADTLVNAQASGLLHFYIKDTVTGLKAIFTFPVGKSCDVYIKYIKSDASCGASDGSFTVLANNGDAPYTYSMDGINFQTDSTFSGLSAGNYSVSVKDANGAITSSIVTLYNKCPKVVASSTNTHCDNNNGSIQAHGYLGSKPYQFSLDNINYQNDSLFSGLGKKIYTVYLRDARNFIDSITNIAVNEVCFNLNAIVINETCGNKNGSITTSCSGGILPYQYSIDGINFQNYNIFSNLDSGRYLVSVKDSNSTLDTLSVYIGNTTGPSVFVVTDTALCNNTGGSIIINSSSGSSPFQYSIDGLNYQNSNTFLNDTAGVYFVTVRDANGCITKDTVTLFKYTTPTVFIGKDTSLCSGQSLFLNAGTGFANYIWSNNSSASGITIANAGKYYVTVTDNHHCIVSDTINVSYNQTPVFSLGSDTALCEKQTLLLQSNAVGNYLWEDGSTQNQKTVNSPGLYWLQINNNNCIYKDSIVITYIPIPRVNLPTDTILCNQNTLLLNAAQTGNTAVYLWQDGSTVPDYLVKNEGDYIVKVTQNGCSSYDTCLVQYQQTPQMNIEKDTSKCRNESLLLNVNFPGDTYIWQDLSSLPTYTVNSPGVYYCTINNYCGSVIDTFNVVDIICECTLIIPSAFSPNGDGINDYFKPNIDCVTSYYSMIIFDRDGQVVFSSNSITEYWDGTFHRKPVPIGTYYYILKIKGVTDSLFKQKTGSITVLR